MNRSYHAGFTLTELLIVVTIIAILATIAVPSYQDSLRAQRVEGAAEALLGTLQNAKLEGIKRNSSIRIAFRPTTLNTNSATWCFGMVLVPTPDTSPATTCDCTVANSCMAGSVVSSTDYRGVTMNVNTAAFRTFNFLRGTSNGGTVVFSAGNNKSVGVRTSASGRNRLCKPAGSTVSRYSQNSNC